VVEEEIRREKVDDEEQKGQEEPEEDEEEQAAEFEEDCNMSHTHCASVRCVCILIHQLEQGFPTCGPRAKVARPASNSGPRPLKE